MEDFPSIVSAAAGGVSILPSLGRERPAVWFMKMVSRSLIYEICPGRFQSLENGMVGILMEPK
jgi:hypothetical protein